MPKTRPPSGMDAKLSALDQALQIIQRAGLRTTKPRRTVLGVLVAEHGPFSVDEVMARAKGQSLDRVTVYRCLATFEEIGIARRCEFGDGVSRYEYTDGEHHHHHVTCKHCRTSETIEGCIPERLLQSVKALGYRDISHSLEFFGICRQCCSA